MIYLITGTPGTGKTSFFVKMLLDNKDGLFKNDDGTPRPLYFNHIDGLDKRALKAQELTDDDLISMPLQDLVPTGSLVVVDECDYIYPTRGPSRPIPDYVRTLKELRHEGLTLILITQSVNMIDSYVRALVGKHWHLARRPIGSKVFEFQGAESNLSESNLKTSAWRPYKPDKRTFKYYKSASKHIKFKKSLHWAFYAMPLIFAFAAYMIYKALSPAVAAFDSAKNDAMAASQPFAQQYNNDAQQNDTLQQAADIIGIKGSDYVPRLPDHPATAPIYDTVRQVKNLEVIVGCVRSANTCNCYTEQATLVTTTDVYCNAFIDKGKFDPFRQRTPTPAPVSSPANPDSVAQDVLALDSP